MQQVKILCHVLEDDDAIIMVLKEQLLINEVEAVIFHNDEDFLKALINNVHLCVIDFSPTTITSRNGTDLTRIVVDKYEDCKVIVITGLNSNVHEECEQIINFFHVGGFRWLQKDNPHFISVFTKYVQQAIHIIKKNLALKKIMQDNTGSVIRDRPEKLSPPTP